MKFTQSNIIIIFFTFPFLIIVGTLNSFVNWKEPYPQTQIDRHIYIYAFWFVTNRAL